MWVSILLKVILFMLFVPGVHFSIPPGGSLREQAILHGLVFAVVNYYVYLYVRPMLEGFENPSTRTAAPCPPGYRQCPSGDCVHSSGKYGQCPGGATEES
jgi:hypothetical protein